MPVVYRPHPLCKQVMPLRMLELSAGKGGEVIIKLNCAELKAIMVRAGYELYRPLVIVEMEKQQL